MDRGRTGGSWSFKSAGSFLPGMVTCRFCAVLTPDRNRAPSRASCCRVCTAFQTCPPRRHSAFSRCAPRAAWAQLKVSCEGQPPTRRALGKSTTGSCRRSRTSWRCGGFFPLVLKQCMDVPRPTGLGSSTDVTKEQTCSLATCGVDS